MVDALPNNQAGFQWKVFSIGRTDKIQVDCNMNIKRVSPVVTTIVSETTTKELTTTTTTTVTTTTSTTTTSLQTTTASTTQEKIDKLLMLPKYFNHFS